VREQCASEQICDNEIACNRYRLTHSRQYLAERFQAAGDEIEERPRSTLRQRSFEPLGSEFKSRRGRHLFAPTKQWVRKVEIGVEFTKEVLKAVYQYSALLGLLRRLKNPLRHLALQGKSPCIKNCINNSPLHPLTSLCILS
jgi:hypothetical protein